MKEGQLSHSPPFLFALGLSLFCKNLLPLPGRKNKHKTKTKQIRKQKEKTTKPSPNICLPFVLFLPMLPYCPQESEGKESDSNFLELHPTLDIVAQPDGFAARGAGGAGYGNGGPVFCSCARASVYFKNSRMFGIWISGLGVSTTFLLFFMKLQPWACVKVVWFRLVSLETHMKKLSEKRNAETAVTGLPPNASFQDPMCACSRGV